MNLSSQVLAQLNRDTVVKTVKYYHGSQAVRNLSHGTFTTRDGKKYAVNAKGEIRRLKKDLTSG